MEEEPDGDSRPPDLRAGLVFGAHWGLLAFFAGLGGYYLVTLVMTGLVSGFDQFDSFELPDVGPLLLVAFLPNLFLGLGPAIGSRRWGRGLRADFGLLPTRRDIKVGLACGGIALAAGYLINLVLLGLYGTDRISDGPLDELSGGVGNDTPWLILAGVIVVFAAPLTEELLVRGALWRALEHYRIPSWAILVLTAVVFAHLHGEPTRTVALVGQGLAIGLARLKTGRVGASLVAHAANNLPPALLLFAGI
ncbi:CPBP family intramembrane glutamic endopeptidase [Amycolatopsis anabasis]|uniref:CPBP family intramembrane glutamic endopeptidase n=1 Tax=Amycolatopsis anabasis TaxID=1840409 RepID=UPI001FE8E48D|nr:type II CAAX endopeptidase family protein [Amycolatopsis anabasis]